MSTAKNQSIGEELIRIIRAEIRAYDERKDDAVRLRAVADQAVAEAEQAAKAARESKPNSIGGAISAAIVGDLNAQAIDALFKRQQKPLVDFTIGGRSIDRVAQQTQAAADELLRNQQQSAEKTTTWKPVGTGENRPRNRWWQRSRG
ncbi:Uncharacterised protein [Mycobacteroides abscessus subsp. abscessus]|uniref:hypothetical protein n=1 Tax=Mycobacteroides abscessus TaxID=36809 RepID=UPI0009271A66|nr:hypothetical protein [Mycobacteroides abscessus]SHY52751.1 Uncharacterised protein [Mycobacteroides abscessus subsp. abscessus]SIH55142.1 Uncharacterised protein [Mycobacteroides abscessus subsp. abscessus]SIK80930.1 Uncharacterised protein [Mycobacteroides abscessus subsp. abscessus]